MLLASAVDITIGWAWHTAYRARWHWKLKREGALVAAGVIALVGAFDTAHSLYHGTGGATSPAVAMITAPAAPPVAIMPVVASVAAPDTNAATTQSTATNAAVQASTAQFPIIQDQTGSIDQADPVETILPMDPSAQKDDPIAQKINERYSDAAPAEPARKKLKGKQTRTASRAIAKKQAAGDDPMD